MSSHPELSREENHFTSDNQKSVELSIREKIKLSHYKVTANKIPILSFNI